MYFYKNVCVFRKGECEHLIFKSENYLKIFFCIFFQSIRKYEVVDIFGIVYEMRKERVWMVQTEQQYICIHQCLLAVLEGKENDPQIHEIHENEGFEDDEGIAESGM